MPLCWSSRYGVGTGPKETLVDEHRQTRRVPLPRSLLCAGYTALVGLFDKVSCASSPMPPCSSSELASATCLISPKCRDSSRLDSKSFTQNP